MGVTVKYNHLPAIIAAMPKEIADGVGDAADDLTETFKATLWIDTGLVRRVTSVHDERALHAEVWIGYNRGHGFYSRFQEWGTVKQAARPIVGPTTHAYEPAYAKNMADHVKKACNAK